jgi:hypothetical protein
MASNRKRKLNLWNKDPHCFYCGVETVIIDQPRIKGVPSNLATLDHKYSKFDYRRYLPTNGTEERNVLACFRCNNKRAAFEDKLIPSEEKLLRGMGLKRGPVEGFVCPEFVPST